MWSLPPIHVKPWHMYHTTFEPDSIFGKCFLLAALGSQMLLLLCLCAAINELDVWILHLYVVSEIFPSWCRWRPQLYFVMKIGVLVSKIFQDASSVSNASREAPGPVVCRCAVSAGLHKDTVLYFLVIASAQPIGTQQTAVSLCFTMEGSSLSKWVRKLNFRIYKGPMNGLLPSNTCPRCLCQKRIGWLARHTDTQVTSLPHILPLPLYGFGIIYI